MTPERWRQIEDIYHSALEREPVERATFLNQVDPELRRDVESLLAQPSGDGPLARPAWEGAGTLLDLTVTQIVPGAQLGPYQIEAPIGAGGMGEVFRGRDTRLGRAVAIKVVDEKFSARFEREARAISALNHPYICTLYDVGSNYLVMELCDGETLAARLTRGRLSIQETVRYGAQIAEALSAAHAKGIVHRDLKPGNIMIAKSGVKVLDFGLAKSQHDATMTATNVVMGTPAYMAPEQREGRECDARTDIYALGLVLYEMLTGKRAFDGSNTVSVIAAIMEREPPSIGEVSPHILDWALRRCLAKDPDERWQTARDLRAALEMVAAGGIQIPRPAEARPVAKKKLLLPIVTGALAIALAITCVFLWRATRPTGDAGQAKFDDLQITPLTSTGTASAPAISPDGKYVAYVQREGDAFSLRMRHIDTASDVQIAPPVPGMEIRGAAVSPDGGFVEFTRGSLTVVRQELWRVPFLGGTPRKLLDSFVSAAGWSPDGRHIAFVRGTQGHQPQALMVADADGSHERQVYARQFPRLQSRTRPAWSPDGSIVAVLGRSVSPGGMTAEQVVAVDVASGADRVLPVRLLFAPQGLSPEWLDPRFLVLSGAVEDGAPNQLWRLSYPGGQLSRLTNDLNNYYGVSLTADRGTLVTGRSDVRVGVWIGDASGRSGEEAVPIAPSPGTTRVAWAGERLLHTTAANGRASIVAFTGHASPDETIARGLIQAATSDGRTIMFTSVERNDHAGLWKVDADGRHAVQLVNGNALWPVVTRDDRNVVFVSNRGGEQRLWSVSIDGGRPTQLGNAFAYQPDVSPDGKSLVFGASNTRGELGICDLPTCATVRNVRTREGGPISRWTPDGKGIAFYDVGAGGNLWVQPLDGSPPRQLTHFADNRIIGDFAWSRDGKRLAIARFTVTNDIVLFQGLRPR